MTAISASLNIQYVVTVISALLNIQYVVGGNQA
jgi:hypothetical protein